MYTFKDAKKAAFPTKVESGKAFDIEKDNKQRVVSGVMVFELDWNLNLKIVYLCYDGRLFLELVVFNRVQRQ